MNAQGQKRGKEKREEGVGRDATAGARGEERGERNCRCRRPCRSSHSSLLPFLTPRQWIIACALAAALAIGGWLLLRRSGPPVDETWLRMQERGAWRVGMDPSFPPFETLDAQGVPVGYDVDLARAIAAEWGLEAEIVAIGYDSLLDALLVDRVDAVISAFPFNARMTEDIHYSPPYFEAGVRLVAGAGAAFEDVEDLNGRSVAVEWGSRGDAIARRLQRAGAGFERLPFQSAQEALDGLLSGVSDAALIDGVTLRLAQGEGKPVRAIGPALESDPYVIAVSIKAPLLQSALYEALMTLEQEERLDLLEERWFGPKHQ